MPLTHISGGPSFLISVDVADDGAGGVNVTVNEPGNPARNSDDLPPIGSLLALP